MKKLIDLVKIIENNEECVILKVNKNAKIDLIKTGYFDGNEELIRYTKGRNHQITIFYDNNSTFSWGFGESGYTLVSEKVDRMKSLIVDCIENDMNIYCGKDLKLIKESIEKYRAIDEEDEEENEE